jgi:hypothetical protein
MRWHLDVLYGLLAVGQATTGVADLASSWI